ncbi:hypothetical protein AMECASPLE_014280, partial [Ameca splendens]
MSAPSLVPFAIIQTMLPKPLTQSPSQLCSFIIIKIFVINFLTFIYCVPCTILQ